MFLTILQATEATTKAVQQTTSLMDIFFKMGFAGMLVCVIIFILSIIALFVFVERMVGLSKAGKISSNFMSQIKESMMHGNIDAAKELCARNHTPMAKVVGKGLSRLGQPVKDIQMAMEITGNVEAFELEKRLNVLSMISKLAPMFGFIGTIAGVIKIFYDISSTGDYNIEVISGGLYNKMITSALGLTLGIIAFSFYFIINNKVDQIIHKMEKCSLEFLDILNSPTK